MKVRNHSACKTNNIERIKELIQSDFDEEKLQSFHKIAQGEYTKVMNKFMTGTGGGSYVPVNWDKRDALVIRDDYFMAECESDYITFIHMFDKQHGFCYQNIKQDVPDDIAIDDDKSGKKQGNVNKHNASRRLEKFMNKLDSREAAAEKKQERLLSIVEKSIESLVQSPSSSIVLSTVEMASPSLQSPITSRVPTITSSLNTAIVLELESVKEYLLQQIASQDKQIEVIESNISKHKCRIQESKDCKNKDNYRSA